MPNFSSVHKIFYLNCSFGGTRVFHDVVQMWVIHNFPDLCELLCSEYLWKTKLKAHSFTLFLDPTKFINLFLIRKIDQRKNRWKFAHNFEKFSYMKIVCLNNIVVNKAIKMSRFFDFETFTSGFLWIICLSGFFFVSGEI